MYGGISAFILVLIGRTIYGIGSESLSVIQTTMVGIWFNSGRELSFAMGLSLSMNRFVRYVPETLLINNRLIFCR
jgi:hypothetical protein